MVGTRDTLHQRKFGWIMSIVPAMKQASHSVVMVGGEVTTAGTVKMWEWYASIHQKLSQVEYFKLVLSVKENRRLLRISSTVFNVNARGLKNENL